LSHVSAFKAETLGGWVKDTNNRYEGGYLCGKCYEEEKKKPSSLPSGTINVKNLKNNPELLGSIVDRYTILQDNSVVGTCDNLLRAINVMAEKGWRCVNIAVYRDVALGIVTVNFYALMEKKE